jgi:DNA topoisomerase-1
LSPEQAEENGLYSGDGYPWKPLPPVLYHTTTAATAIEREGFKNPELVEARGLGGGDPQAISTTDSLATATSIHSSLLDGKRVVDGELTVPDMVASAKAGEGAKRPWLEDMYEHVGGRRGEDGVPIAFDAQMRGKALANGLGQPPDWKGDEAYDWKPATKYDAGWLGGDGQQKYSLWERDLTPKEQMEKTFDFYKAWIALRAAAGGPDNPVIWGSNVEYLRRIKASEIRILRLETAPGSMGKYLGTAENEYRVYSPRVLRVAGYEKIYKIDGSQGLVPNPFLRKDAMWDEQKHPRAVDGKFAETEGEESDVQEATPEEFIAARNAKVTRSSYLGHQTVDELKTCKLFLLHGGKVGGAVTKDGDCINLFNNGGPRGSGSDMLRHLIENGGRTLDCFDGRLPQIYGRSGFKAVARVKFNDELAPDGWDYEQNGRPDIVFMAYAPGGPHEYRGEGESFDDYARAKAHSRTAAGLEKSSGTGPVGLSVIGGSQRTGLGGNQLLASVQSIEGYGELLDKAVIWNEADHPRDDQGKFAGKGYARRAKHAGKGRGWVDESGDPLPEHLRGLRIPPAWKDVQYDPDPNADLMVKGVDAKGRVQALYSERFKQQQADAKFARIEEMDAKYKAMERQVAADVKAGNEDAACMRLIMSTGVRPGSDRDTGAAVQAYGATTLMGRHVTQVGDEVHLQFVGKKGEKLDIAVLDAAVAKDLLARQAAVGAGGRLFNTDATRLLVYSHTMDGGGFKTKDFRTYLGTRLAQDMIAESDAPRTMKEYKRSVMRVAKHVSQRLGNTPSVALKSYIHPIAFARWRMYATAA